MRQVPSGVPARTSAWRNERVRFSSHPETWLLVLLLSGVTAFLLIHNISFFPGISLDEGSHLQVPKTLVLDGEYAQKTAEGYHYYGPGVATGPTVMLPVALSFKLFGIGLVQGRVVSGVYIVLALIVFYLAARHLFGKPVALCTAFLLLAAPGFLLSNSWEGGRVVVGEVPALFYLTAGLLLFWKSIDRPTLGRLLVVGILWGLAFITKNQFTLILVPAFVVLGLLGRFYFRAIRVRDVWLPLGVASSIFGLWLLCQLTFIGDENVASNLATIRGASGHNYLVFSPPVMLRSARYLISIDVFYGWALPGIAYGIVLSLQRTAHGFKYAMITLTIVIWLSWYTLASIGYPRYAYPPLHLSTIFIAKLFFDLIGGFSLPRIHEIVNWAQGRHLERARHLAILLFLILIVASPIERDIRETLTADDRSIQEFAEYLQAEVDEAAVIATVEYSLGFLTDHTFHYPPTSALAVYELSIAEMDLSAVQEYDPLDYDPDYLAYGPFGKGMAVLYSITAIEQCWEHVHSVGDHDLYARKPVAPDC